MNLAVDLLAAVYLVFLGLASYFAATGLPTLRRLPQGEEDSGRLVSIILPVKNESDTLRDSLESLLSLDYREKEIIAVYGESTDGTRDILDRYAGRIKIVPEQARPRGWLGKSWACHQGYLTSAGDVLLFTDGDVVLSPMGLTSALSFQAQNQIDLLSCWPRMVTRVPSERVLLPVGIFMLSLGFRTIASTVTQRGKTVRGANGQFILMPRSAYVSIGGHESVKDAILEDGALGRRSVERGLNVVNASGDGLMQVKPYSNRHELDRAFERFGAGVIPSARYLGAVVAFVAGYFVAPLLLLGAGVLVGSQEVAAAAGTGVAVVVATSSIFYLKYSHLRYLPSFPAAAILLIIDFARGFFRFKRKGVSWKGVLYSREEVRTMAE